MRVIVDTSVWSQALHRRNSVSSSETEALAALIEEGRIVMLGAVRQEILSGIRHIEQFERLKATLEPFPDEVIEAADYVEAASVCNQCLDAGIQVSNTDCLISAVAILRGMQVLSADKDFGHVSLVVPLQLYSVGE